MLVSNQWTAFSIRASFVLLPLAASCVKAQQTDVGVGFCEDDDNMDVYQNCCAAASSDAQFMSATTYGIPTLTCLDAPSDSFLSCVQTQLPTACTVTLDDTNSAVTISDGCDLSLDDFNNNILNITCNANGGIIIGSPDEFGGGSSTTSTGSGTSSTSESTTTAESTSTTTMTTESITTPSSSLSTTTSSSASLASSAAAATTSTTTATSASSTTSITAAHSGGATFRTRIKILYSSSIFVSLTLMIM